LMRWRLRFSADACVAIGGGSYFLEVVVSERRASGAFGL
jgi:hypothetical protein